MYGPYEDICCNSIKRLSLMDVAILVYETYTIKLQCGSHFSIHELYILCNGFILRMTFCECTLWPFGGEGESRREFPRLLFLSIGYVLGRNSVHNIFLGFRYILEIFTINVLSILMYTVVPLTYKKNHSMSLQAFSTVTSDTQCPLKFLHLNFLAINSNWMFLRCFDWNLKYSNLFGDQRQIQFHYLWDY